MRKELKAKNVQFVVQDAKSSSDVKFEDLLSQASVSSFIPEEKINSSDIHIYIYTSGTTGLPKYFL